MTNSLTEPELRALEELEARESPQEWQCNNGDIWIEVIYQGAPAQELVATTSLQRAEYIAALRNAAPSLIASARRELEREGAVQIPKCEDEAAMMCLLGSRWLEDNAPHRLRQTYKEEHERTRKDATEASARRVVELEAEREAMQLEIDQGRDAREMMNDSIDALQSRLAAAERVVEAARRVAEGRVSLESCDLIRDALAAYDRTAGATDAGEGGKK